MRQTIFLLVTLLLCTPLSAAEISQKQLVGEWEFTHWVEKNNKSQKNRVGLFMDFQADGTVMIKHAGATGYKRGSYEVEGDTIIYNDDGGEQVWKVQSFEPDKELVVSYEDALIFLEKADT